MYEEVGNEKLSEVTAVGQYTFLMMTIVKPADTIIKHNTGILDEFQESLVLEKTY